MSVDDFIAERVGQVVGDRWTLDHVLGAGGMAAVYAAHDRQGRVAAVKILHPEMCLRRDVRERFLREGVAANRIEHPGAVAVYEQGTVGDDCAFLVMELLVGETLGERLQRHGTLPVPQVLDVLDQVLDVLAVAHDEGIVHRDLKPDNLFVTNDERVKVLDFGLARLLDSVPGDFKTRSGAALGTFPYMAPEQALGRRAEIDGRADLFSLGATAFRILAQRKVHEADSDAELLMAMASKAAPPLAAVAPHVPGPVAQVIDLSLAFAKEARYPDARAMQADVRAVKIGQPPPFAGTRGSVRGAPTSLAAPVGGVSPTLPDDPESPAGRTAPLGTPVAAATPADMSPISQPAPSLGPQTVEPTAPTSGPHPVLGSLPPVSGSAPLSVPQSSGVPGVDRRGPRSLVALVAGLAVAAVAGVVAIGGSVALLFWWGGGAVSAVGSPPEAEDTWVDPPQLAEPVASGMTLSEGSVRPSAPPPSPEKVTATAKPGKRATKDTAPEGSAKGVVGEGVEAAPEPDAAGKGLESDDPRTTASASARPAAPPPPDSTIRSTGRSGDTSGRPSKPRGRGRGHRKKEDG